MLKKCTKQEAISSIFFENKKQKEPNFDWIKNADTINEVLDDVEKTTGLEVIIDNKIINLRKVNKFLNDILDGEINDAYTAEREYIKKILSDEDSLRNSKDFEKNNSAQKLESIMDGVKNAILGFLFPSELNKTIHRHRQYRKC